MSDLTDALTKMSDKFWIVEKDLLAKGFGAVHDFAPEGFSIHWNGKRICDGEGKPAVDSKVFYRMKYAKELPSFVVACDQEMNRLYNELLGVVEALEEIEDSKGNE